MAATKQQLAALKKARAARKRNLAKVKKTAPKKSRKKVTKARKANPISDKWVVKIFTRKGDIGYLRDWHKFDTEIKKAHGFDKKGSAMMAKALHHAKLPNVDRITIVKKPKGGYGNNPVPPSSKVKIREATKLHENFSGHTPQHIDSVEVEWPTVAMNVGKCTGILYDTIRDGEKERYIHRFKKSAQPTLVASHNGKTLGLIGGNFEFTERGIVDN